MPKGPNNKPHTEILPGGKKQRFADKQQAARVKYLIGYMDQTAALHPGITLHEMSELLAQDYKVAVSAVLKIEEGMADRLREQEGRPKVSPNVRAGGPTVKPEGGENGPTE